MPGYRDQVAPGVRPLLKERLEGPFRRARRLAGFSSSLLWRSTSCTSRADTEPRPPDRRDRSNATRRKSSHVSVGKFIPVVRCVSSCDFDPVGWALVFNMMKGQGYWKMLAIVNCGMSGCLLDWRRKAQDDN